MVVLKYIAPDLAETTSFGAGSEQLGWGRRGAQGAGREEGYIAAALASIDRRLIFCSDCQDACASSSCACTQAFYLDLDSSFAITRTDPTTHLPECCSCCPTGLRAPRSSWTATLALYTGLSITSEMFLARAEQKVGRTIVATTCAFVKCRIAVFRTWLYVIYVRADLFHVGAFGLHWCLIAEGAPTGAEIDSSVPGKEPTSMRSSSLEVMAALPLDGSLGLRPEEDYTYVDQPWNRSFLFGMPFRHVLPQQQTGWRIAVCSRLMYAYPKYGCLRLLTGVAYGVPHSASLLSLPPHQLQIPPTAPQSAGSLVRGAAGGAKL